jgi:hypothetical protein
MFDAVDASFLKGLLEQTNAAQQQVQSTHSLLTNDLRVRDKASSIGL